MKSNRTGPAGFLIGLGLFVIGIPVGFFGLSGALNGKDYCFFIGAAGAFTALVGTIVGSVSFIAGIVRFVRKPRIKPGHCPCGYDLHATRRELEVLTAQPWWPTLPAVVKHNVVMVDGKQMFNRPGPRLVDALSWLVGWINHRPRLIARSFPAEPVGPLGPAGP